MENDCNPIIVAGSGRSGTTWLGNIIAGDEYRILFEPFDFRHVPEATGLGLRPYLRPYGKYPQWHTFFARVLVGNIKNKWIDQDKHRARQVRNTDKILIKEIRANGLLGWLDENFHPRIVYLVRHPVAVIASRLRLRWDTHLDHFLSQLELVDDHLRPYEKHIRDAKTQMQKHTMMWCIENLIPLRQMRKYNWVICRYENLLCDADREVRNILGVLGLQYSDARKNAVVEESRTASNAEGGRRTWSPREWAMLFSKEEMAYIASALEMFSITLYSVDAENLSEKCL